MLAENVQRKVVFSDNSQGKNKLEITFEENNVLPPVDLLSQVNCILRLKPKFIKTQVY